MEIDTDFEKLRQVRVENLAKAAAYGDDYALTHKSTFNNNRSFLFTRSLILI